MRAMIKAVRLGRPHVDGSAGELAKVILDWLSLIDAPKTQLACDLHQRGTGNDSWIDPNTAHGVKRQA